MIAKKKNNKFITKFNKFNESVIINLSQDDFVDLFKNMNQKGSDYSLKFSIQGLRALYDYLDNLSEDLSEDIEADPIALSVVWIEYDDINDVAKDYNISLPSDEDEDEEDNIEAIKEWLEDHTTFIEIEPFNGRVNYFDRDEKCNHPIIMLNY